MCSSSDWISHLFSDIDECKSKSDSCNSNAICTNTVGSHNCKCKIGFRGDGINCIGKYELS